MIFQRRMILQFSTTFCCLQRVWYSNLKSNFFLSFLSSLTHLILFLLYTFRSSSDLLFRNLFLNFDLTMIAFLSSLFINDACLALTYFFFCGVQNFLKMLNKHFENPLIRIWKDHTLQNLV